MSDSTTRSDDEQRIRVRTHIHGDVYTEHLHTGVGNNYAGAGKI